MKLFTSLLGALALTAPAPATATPVTAAAAGNDTCITPGAIPDVTGAELRNFGVVLFRAFDMIDVFGSLDPLQLMAHQTQQMKLYLLSDTLDPVTTETSGAAMNRFNSSFWPQVLPTHTFDEDPDLDVLIVPGGPGMRASDEALAPQLAYLRRMYPRVKIFLTVCTGAGLAARAGVLDGKMATTNKNAWEQMRSFGPKVQWVAPARYVIDGNVWTSSGVTAALDLVFALIDTYWGVELSQRVASYIEHVPRAAEDDPFTPHFNITPTDVQPCRQEL